MRLSLRCSKQDKSKSKKKKNKSKKKKKDEFLYSWEITSESNNSKYNATPKAKEVDENASKKSPVKPRFNI